MTYQIKERAVIGGGTYYVVADEDGNEPSGFEHGTRADAQREIDKLSGDGKRKRRAVVCHDGCSYEGYRMWPGPEKPCPRCGGRVDVGTPSRPAMKTKAGGIGGRTELTWGPWS